MKKRLILFITLLVTAALLATAFVTVSMVNRRYVLECERFLESATKLLSSYPLPEDLESYAKEKAAVFGNDVRLTFIDSSGKVLADSHYDPTTMANHGNREEIRQAMQEGSGHAERISDTTDTVLLYQAKLLENGLIVRVAMPLSNTQLFVRDTIPVLLLVSMIAITFVIWGVGWIVQRFLKPLGDVQKSLEGVLSGDREHLPEPKYIELQPIVAGYSLLIDQIEEHIASIKLQTMKIDNIIRTMREGLILLDQQGNILLKNPSAERMLGLPQTTERQLNLLSLLRTPKLVQAVKKALTEREPSVVDFESQEPVYSALRIYVNPVTEGEGAIILLSDITEILKAENMRREFTANVSHELKTPLTSIRGFAELMSEGMVADEAVRKKYLDFIKLEAERLTLLINDILKLSEMESASIEVDVEPVDLACVAQEVLELVEIKARENGITLDLEGEPAVILAAPDRMKQLVLNLVDNAIKYNIEGGKVHVRTFTDTKTCGISVSDTGIGIPLEHQERIFERFYTVDKGRSKKSGGTGLGLSIVKHVAELYGGSLHLESQPGKGTIISVTFAKYYGAN